jgi:N-acetylglutamate synthase-like GNAT family acetyltransferase
VKETEKNIVVREADSGDASAVAGLYRQLVSTLAPDKHVNVLEERLAEIRSDQNNFLWVLERSGNVLGTAFLTLCLDPMYSRQPFALLDNMVIEQSQQDNGYGETLLSHIERFCEQADCTKIMLLSNSKRRSSHRFFQRRGFSGDSKRGFVKYRSQFERRRSRAPAS